MSQGLPNLVVLAHCFDDASSEQHSLHLFFLFMLQILLRYDDNASKVHIQKEKLCKYTGIIWGKTMTAIEPNIKESNESVNKTH